MSQRSRRNLSRPNYRQLNRGIRAPYDPVPSDEEEEQVGDPDIAEIVEDTLGVDSDEEDNLEILVDQNEEDQRDEDQTDWEDQNERDLEEQHRFDLFMQEESLSDRYQVEREEGQNLEDQEQLVGVRDDPDPLREFQELRAQRGTGGSSRNQRRPGRPQLQRRANRPVSDPFPQRIPRGGAIRGGRSRRGAAAQRDAQQPQHSEEETLISPNGTEWSRACPPHTRPRRFNVLQIQPGPKANGRNVGTIVESFNLIFTDEMLDEICRMTNQYANLSQDVLNAIRPGVMNWVNIDVMELRAFMGLLLRAGLQRSHDLTFDDFWTTTADNRAPIFQAAMSRQRARDIMRFLRFDDVLLRDPTRPRGIAQRFRAYNRQHHLDQEVDVVAQINIPLDNADGPVFLNLPEEIRDEWELPDIPEDMAVPAAPAVPQRNRIRHIESILNQFVANCQLNFEPGANITIDESLVPFHGHCPFRVYMKAKPHRYGIKVWAAVCSSTGYTYNLQVYQGAQYQGPEINQGRRVVMNMMEGLLNQSRGVTTDNFFTTLQLAQDLLEQQTTLVGTIRKGRVEVPIELKTSRRLPQYHSDFIYTPAPESYITLVRFVPKRNKNVLLLSSQHQGAEISNDPRYNLKPEIILHYIRTKGGVDTMDQMVAHFTCQRGSRRWPMKMFMFLLDVGGINAYRIWIGTHPDWKPDKFRRRRRFLFDLTDALIRPQMERRANRGNLKRHVKQAMQLLRIVIPVQAPGVRHQIDPPAPCQVCVRRRTTTRTGCSVCHLPICGPHQNITILCPNCTANPEDDAVSSNEDDVDI